MQEFCCFYCVLRSNTFILLYFLIFQEGGCNPLATPLNPPLMWYPPMFKYVTCTNNLARCHVISCYHRGVKGQTHPQAQALQLRVEILSPYYLFQ